MSIPTCKPIGKPIKTLTHIRFIRSFSTSPPIAAAQPADPVPPRTCNRPSEPYARPERHEIRKDTGMGSVAAVLKPAAAVPPPRRPRSRFPEPDEDTLRLVEWFKDVQKRLPTAPFDVSPWCRVIDPVTFYAALMRDVTAYPRGPRARVLGDDLRRLRHLACT